MANPLLETPLHIDYIILRLLGHRGMTPVCNSVYARLIRTVVEREIDVLFVTGPGRGWLALVVDPWLEGT